ncbi:hypothetical protein [Actinomadura rupiterrae]|uniref:hypothetical protein n=1 Tax=Actinomadura rupiterrae TaxID=559627 RepID=UPI0020A3ED70|nr:hypothetical protein [Actinomadura rupiterrae]MCP2341523.1 hypothetical protein [Actinomadura rupiterrae]
MLERGEISAVVALLEGLAAQHPDAALSTVAARAAATLQERLAAGETATPGSRPEPDLDHDPNAGPDAVAVAAAERRRRAGQARDLAAQARDDAAEERDRWASARAARAVASACSARADAERMAELLRLAELRDDRAAQQPAGQRTPQQQRSDEADRASNRVDRAALRGFLLALQADQEADRSERHANARNRFAAGRDRAAARSDRQAARHDRDQTLIDVEHLAARYGSTRQHIIELIAIIEQGLRPEGADPVASAELDAAAREATPEPE